MIFSYLLTLSSLVTSYYESTRTTYAAGAFTGTNTYNDEPVDDKGLEDPGFKIKYRFLKDSKLLLDFYSVISPGFFDAERGTNGDNAADTAYLNESGNAFRGGHQLELGTDLGGKRDSLQWNVGFGFTYNFEREITYLKGDSDNAGANFDYVDTEENFFTLGLRTGAQYAITKKLFVGLGISLEYIQEKDITNSKKGGGATISETNVTINDSHLDFEINTNLKYLVTSNILGRFDFGYSKAGDYDVKTTETTISTNSVNAIYHYAYKDISEIKVSVGLDYSF